MAKPNLRIPADLTTARTLQRADQLKRERRFDLFVAALGAIFGALTWYLLLSYIRRIVSGG